MANGVNKGDLNSATSQVVNALSSQGADLSNVNANLNNLKSSVDSVKTSLDNNANDPALTQTLNTIKGDLGDGFLLVEDAVSKVNAELGQLQGAIADKLAEIINLTNRIVTVNTETHQLQVSDSIRAEEQAGPAEGEAVPFTPGTPNASEDIGTLSSTSSLENLNLQGFAVLATALGSIKTGVLESLSGLQQHVVAGNTEATLHNQQQEAKAAQAQANKKDDGGVASNKLKQYLEQLTGPLNSIASGIMMLSLSVVALSLAPLDPTALASIVIFSGCLIGVFAALSAISNKYKENEQDLDPKQQTSITHILSDFGDALMKVTLSFVMVLAVTTLLTSNIAQGVQSIVTMAALIGMTFLVVKGLNTIIQNGSDGDPDSMVGQSSALGQLMNGFSKMVMMIAVTCIVCSLLQPIIVDGMLVATGILLITFATILGLTFINKKLQEGGSAEDMDAFIKLIKQFSTTVMITAGVMILLGFMPMDIIIQGGLVVVAIMGLNLLMIFALKKVLESGNGIDEAQVNALTGLLSAVTIMVGVMSVLIIIMGFIGLDVIMQGIISMAMIMAMPIVLLKILSNIQVADIAKSMITLALLSVFILAVAGITIMLVNNIQDPVGAVLCAVALVLIAGAFVLMAFAAVLLANMASTLMQVVPPGLPVFVAAVVGVAMLVPIALIMAGTAVAVTALFKLVGVEEVLTSALALLALAGAFALMAVTTLLLAGLAPALLFGVGMAIWGLGLLMAFVYANRRFVMDPAVKFFQTNGEEVTQAIDSVQVAASSFAEICKTMTEYAGAFAGALFPMLAAIIALRGIKAFVIGLGSLFVLTSIVAPYMVAGSEALNSAIDSFANVLTKINGLTIPEGGKLTAAKAMASGIKSLYKKILDIPLVNGKEGNTTQIDALAASLEKLAGTNAGLREVADSLRDIAAATKEVNELGEMNIKSAEAMTGNGEIATGGQNVEPVGKEESTVDIEDLKKDVAEIKGNMATLVNNIGSLVGELHNLTTHFETMGKTSVSAELK